MRGDESMRAPRPGRVSDWVSTLGLAGILTIFGVGWHARGELAAQTRQLATVRNEVSGIKGDIAGLKAHIDRLDEAVTENKQLREEVSALESRVEELRVCLKRPGQCQRDQL